MMKLNFGIIPEEIKTEILMYLNADDFKNIDFITCHILGITNITNKALQKHFIDNLIFIEFRFQKINCNYVLHKFLSLLSRENNYMNPIYLKVLLKENIMFNINMFNFKIVNWNLDIINILLNDNRLTIDNGIHYFLSMRVLKYAEITSNFNLIKTIVKFTKCYESKKYNFDNISNFFFTIKSINLYIDNRRTKVQVSCYNNLVSALAYNLLKNPEIQDNLLLKYSAKYGKYDVIEYLLCNYDIDPSINDNFCLRYSFINGHIDIVKLLLKDKKNRVKIEIITDKWILKAKNRNNNRIVNLLRNGYFKN